jgi:hypothetical protein
MKSGLEASPAQTKNAAHPKVRRIVVREAKRRDAASSLPEP